MEISPGDSSTRPLAWITGANGLIGNYLVKTAPVGAPNFRVRALTRGDLDLRDERLHTSNSPSPEGPDNGAFFLGIA